MNVSEAPPIYYLCSLAPGDEEEPEGPVSQRVFVQRVVHTGTEEGGFGGDSWHTVRSSCLYRVQQRITYFNELIADAERQRSELLQIEKDLPEVNEAEVRDKTKTANAWVQLLPEPSLLIKRRKTRRGEPAGPVLRISWPAEARAARPPTGRARYPPDRPTRRGETLPPARGLARRGSRRRDR
jgi:hypothetical protein